MAIFNLPIFKFTPPLKLKKNRYITFIRLANDYVLARIKSNDDSI